MFYEKRLKDIVKEDKVIFIYVSKDDELPTIDIINDFLKIGKTVVVPRCIVEKRQMVCQGITALSDLERGAYGILEPKTNVIVPKEEIDVFVVPGKTFDEKGNRKGRGLGYFDRFLEDIKEKKPIIALSKEENIKKELSCNSWDVPVDIILTEKREIVCR
ncbi:MAG: 5-formyltetrahydrofolate cyclo-ligase [Candidatus Woesearchaeota archaeon]